MTKELTLFGYPIRCRLTRLDDGIHVLLTGGQKSHIGAISTAEPGSPAQTVTFPGHKDQYISAPWAEALAKAAGVRCCTVCGIHYDNATPEQIHTILTETDRLLAEIISRL